jgi:hypothetical protein
MVNAATSLGVQLGIYTTATDWKNIFTDKLTDGTAVYYYNNSIGYVIDNPFSWLPLWLPRYDSTKSMDFFYPTAGWSDVFVKQISGGSTYTRRVGSGRICLNYMSDLNITRDYYDNQVLRPIMFSNSSWHV